jgi:hypothetical protein
MSLSFEERSAAWRRLLAEQRGSGMTVVAWCASRNLRISTFYYWHKKAAQTPTASAPGWVSLSVSDAAQGGDTLTLRVGRVSVDVPSGFDRRLLTEVLGVLEARC